MLLLSAVYEVLGTLLVMMGYCLLSMFALLLFQFIIYKIFNFSVYNFMMKHM